MKYSNGRRENKFTEYAVKSHQMISLVQEFGRGNKKI
jgi:hypothetical protein